jgi:hypothetical protein
VVLEVRKGGWSNACMYVNKYRWKKGSTHPVFCCKTPGAAEVEGGV